MPHFATNEDATTKPKKSLLTEKDKFTESGTQYRQIGLYVCTYQKIEKNFWRELKGRADENSTGT